MADYVPQMVLSDEERFKQCCSALIQNALDNSQVGEKNKINITIRYHSSKQLLYFEVEEYKNEMRHKDLG